MTKKFIYSLLAFSLFFAACSSEVAPTAKSEVLANLEQSTTPGQANIDLINEQQIQAQPIPLAGTVKVAGWAVDPLENTPVDELWIAVGEQMFQVDNHNIPRPDVATHFGVPALENVGFDASFSTENLTPGASTLSLFVINKARNIYYPVGQAISVSVAGN